MSDPEFSEQLQEFDDEANSNLHYLFERDRNKFWWFEPLEPELEYERFSNRNDMTPAIGQDVECVMCGALVWTLAPDRDVTCRTCEEGWHD